MRVLRAGLRTSARLLLALALVVGLVGSLPADAATPVTATENVNVRSGAGTSHTIIGSLHRGQTVTARSESRGWTRITYGKRTGYVASAYLSVGDDLPSGGGISTGSVRVTTTAVNLRKGAGLSYAVLRVLAKGARVTMTGKTARGFAEVIQNGVRGWTSSQYLTASRSGLPAVIGTRVATAALDIRTSSGAGSRTVGEVKKGTRLSVTGATQNGRAQIVYRGAVRWVTAKYLRNAATTLPSVPALPKVTGTRYATTALDIRSTSANAYTAVSEVPRGTKLKITGVVRNGRMQIIWDQAVRWVTAKYLSRTKPSGGGSQSYAVERGLKPNAVKVHRAAMARFPQIRTYYGVRPDPIPDHPSGRALDLMIPSYRSASGKALGAKVAAWARANARSLGIQYVIWNQHIWNVQRDREGWRFMANRGSDSANHKNHVHVTVYG